VEPWLDGFVLIKSIDDQLDGDALKLEREVQLWLAGTGHVPLVYDNEIALILPGYTPRPGIMIEEYIQGEELYKIKASCELYFTIGSAVRKCHDVPISSMPEALKKQLSNDYLSEVGTYDPIPIMKSFFEEAMDLGRIGSSQQQRIEALRSAAYIELMNVRPLFLENALPVLIHADLSLANMLVEHKTGALKIIDWIDARLDTPSCDVAQFLWLSNATDELKEAFLRGYGPTWITPSALHAHFLLIVLYEIGRSVVFRAELGEVLVEEKWLSLAEQLVGSRPRE